MPLINVALSPVDSSITTYVFTSPEPIGDVSSAVVFYVRNPGTATNTITLPFNFSGTNAADGIITSNQCANVGGVVAAGSYCTITFVFQPQSGPLGTRSFALVLSSTAGSYTVNISGTAGNIIGAPPAVLLAQVSTPFMAQVGQPITINFTASGGTPPYTWSAPSFPPGLSLSASGVLSGTPIFDGSYLVAAMVMDSGSPAQMAVASLALTATDPLPIPGPPGAQGPQGIAGPPGPAGTNGTNGKTPTKMTCTVSRSIYTCTVTASQ